TSILAVTSCLLLLRQGSMHAFGPTSQVLTELSKTVQPSAATSVAASAHERSMIEKKMAPQAPLSPSTLS
ncbi:MAG: hypothetical protein KIG95_09755, partial [Comamonas sp.]|nr:hypothetical protein [Comamonas sp.]